MDFVVKNFGICLIKTLSLERTWNRFKVSRGHIGFSKRLN
jgi:hypothetical protein